MGLARDDRWVADALGRALAGAQVYWCNQPAMAPSTQPPSPLALTYADLFGIPEDNPQLTDGFGHASAYVDNSVLYTLVFYHPLFGPNPIVLKDQTIGGSSAGGGTTPVAQEAVGVVDGENTVFTFVASTLSQPVIMVYAGGTFQSPTIDYPAPTLVDGLWTIDFNTPPNSGPIMVVVFI